MDIWVDVHPFARRLQQVRRTAGALVDLCRKRRDVVTASARWRGGLILTQGATSTWKWYGVRSRCLANRLTSEWREMSSPWGAWSVSSSNVMWPRTTMATWFHVLSVIT